MLLSLKSNKETKPASTAGFFLSALSHPHKLHLRKLLIGNRIAHTAACRQRNGGQALKQTLKRVNLFAGVKFMPIFMALIFTA